MMAGKLKENSLNAKKILPVIFLVLFSAGFGYVSWVLKFGPVKILRYYILVYTVYYLACVDLKTRIVPNRILLILLAVRTALFLAEALLYPEYILAFLSSSVSGAVLGMAVLLTGNVLCRKGMGFGDIKLSGVIGYYVGPQAVMFVLFFSLLTAAVYSIVLLLGKKISAKDEIPFVPFVFAGLAVTCLLGA